MLVRHCPWSKRLPSSPDGRFLKFPPICKRERNAHITTLNSGGTLILRACRSRLSFSTQFLCTLLVGALESASALTSSNPGLCNASSSILLAAVMRKSSRTQCWRKGSLNLPVCKARQVFKLSPSMRTRFPAHCPRHTLSATTTFSISRRAMECSCSNTSGGKTSA